MMSRSSTRAIGALAIVLLTASPAWAVRTIDTFDDPSPAIMFDMVADGNVVLDPPRAGSGILGTRRLTKDGNPFETGDSISIGAGALVVVSQPFQAPDSTVITLLDYDFSGLPGGSVSLAGDTGLELTFSFIENYDFPGQDFLDSIITLQTTSGMLQAVGAAFADLNAGTRTDFVPYTSFTGTGSLNEVTSLQIRFNDPSTSRRLDFTVMNLASVPEPASLALVALASLGARISAGRARRIATPRPRRGV